MAFLRAYEQNGLYPIAKLMKHDLEKSGVKRVSLMSLGCLRSKELLEVEGHLMTLGLHTEDCDVAPMEAEINLEKAIMGYPCKAMWPYVETFGYFSAAYGNPRATLEPDQLRLFLEGCSWTVIKDVMSGSLSTVTGRLIRQCAEAADVPAIMSAVSKLSRFKHKWAIDESSRLINKAISMSQTAGVLELIANCRAPSERFRSIFDIPPSMVAELKELIKQKNSDVRSVHEIYGDAILKETSIKILMRTHTNAKAISPIITVSVSNRVLTFWGESKGLVDLVPQPTRQTGKTVANLVEVMLSLMRRQGMEAEIEAVVESILKEPVLSDAVVDIKCYNAILTYCQARDLEPPTVTVEDVGTSADPKYVVVVDCHELGQNAGEGKSKMLATADASRKFLREIKNQPPYLRTGEEASRLMTENRLSYEVLKEIGDTINPVGVDILKDGEVVGRGWGVSRGKAFRDGVMRMKI